MSGLFKRFGFAMVVAGALALMALVVIGKSALSAFGGDARAAAGHAKGPGGPGGAPAIGVTPVVLYAFAEGIQAIGTAQARESIVLTPKISDTIRRIRFDSGDRVRQGQVLVEMSSVEQAADLTEARAADEAAQQELRRYQELYDRGFASQARLDTVRTSADAARARVAAGGSRIADRTISAPFAGVIGLRTASPGQYMRPGDQIGTLDDISQVKLDFDVAEPQIAHLRQGAAIVVRTAAYPDRTFNGTIADIDSRIDPATRTVRVRAILPNPGEQLRPGMLMTVDVRSNPHDALAAPEVAVLDEGNNSYVFRVVAGNGRQTVERVPVQTGQRSDGLVEIVSGLSEGDLVVTDGVQSVNPGQPIRLQEASADDGLRGSAPAPSSPSR
jgi:membrane fusion protein (multidrug efflux system)